MFTLSGFADEIDPRMDEQIRVLTDLNIRFVELRGVDGRNVTTLSLDETKELKRKLDANGIRVSAIGSPLGKIAVTDDFDSHLKLFDHVMAQADILETGFIRLFSFYQAFDARDEVLRRMEAFIRHTSQGVTLLHENEKDIYGNIASRCLDLMKTFEGAPLKATFDPANFIQENQEILPAYDMLRPYIAYMHVKDARMADGSVVPSGMGDGHWPELIQRLRGDGFDGFLSMEPHLTNFSGFHALEKDASDNGKADMSQGEAMFRLAHQALLTHIKSEEIK